jgi:hypothetical protein
MIGTMLRSGLPLGSPPLDVLWFGGIERDRFRLGSPPLADLWISQCRPGPFDGYRRQFDPSTAVASQSFRGGSGPVKQEAWMSARGAALIVRRESDDSPIFLRLDAPFSTGSVSRALGGLDLVVRLPKTAVVALRVICDGLMTYAEGRLRLDMAANTILIVAAEDVEPGSAAYTEMDDRLCELAVELARPGGYAALRGSS